MGKACGCTRVLVGLACASLAPQLAAQSVSCTQSIVRLGGTSSAAAEVVFSSSCAGRWAFANGGDTRASGISFEQGLTSTFGRTTSQLAREANAAGAVIGQSSAQSVLRGFSFSSGQSLFAAGGAAPNLYGAFLPLFDTLATSVAAPADWQLTLSGRLAGLDAGGGVSARPGATGDLGTVANTGTRNLPASLDLEAVSPVPEPMTYAMQLLGLALAGGLAWQRSRRTQRA